jgi:hypothetical protein
MFMTCGWRVVDARYGDVSADVSLRVDHFLRVPGCSGTANALWEVLCLSVDGKGPTEGAPAPQRWLDLPAEEMDAEKVVSTFLYVLVKGCCPEIRGFIRRTIQRASAQMSNRLR